MTSLTDAELDILNQTVQLWNSYVALPYHHPSELKEMERDIHDIQNRLCARPTTRELVNSTVSARESA